MPQCTLLTSADRTAPIPLPDMQLALISAADAEAGKMWVPQAPSERAGKMTVTWQTDARTDENEEPVWQTLLPAPNVNVPVWPKASEPSVVTLTHLHAPAKPGLYRLALTFEGG